MKRVGGMIWYEIITLVIAAVSASAFVVTARFSILAFKAQNKRLRFVEYDRTRPALAIAYAVESCTGMALIEWWEREQRWSANYKHLEDACAKAMDLAHELELDFPGIVEDVTFAVDVALAQREEHNTVTLQTFVFSYEAVIRTLCLCSTNSFYKTFQYEIERRPGLRTVAQKLYDDPEFVPLCIDGCERWKDR